MNTTVSTSRRRAPWRTTRRVTDYVFRTSIPGKHHSLESSLAALLSIREMSA